MIAIPLSGRPLHPQMMFAYNALHAPMCYNVTASSTWQQPVDVARQWFAEQAIERGCKYLFFIDEDVTPPGHALRQLIYQAEHHPEGMVFGGIYCHKAPPPMPMIFKGYGAGPYWDWKVGEFFEVDGISMGCTLIRTEVFQHLEKPWFKTVDSIDKYYDGAPGAEMWTEDLYFCHKVREAGFKVYADGGVLCEHWSIETMEPTVLPEDCAPRRRAGVVKGDKKIVDLGCGESPYKTDEGDVLTVDIREEVKPDYRCDLGKLPFATGEFDIVFSSHTLEHFPRHEVSDVLDEWVRILKDKGELRLVLPNLEWAAKEILDGKLVNGSAKPNTDIFNVLYGAQTYHENAHMNGFTPKLVEAMLTERGFKRIDILTEGYNIHTRAWRVPPDTKQVPLLGQPPKDVSAAKKQIRAKKQTQSKRAKAAR
jgi:predicted SAM-dependent methyltransferase